MQTALEAQLKYGGMVLMQKINGTIFKKSITQEFIEQKTSIC